MTKEGSGTVQLAPRLEESLNNVVLRGIVKMKKSRDCASWYRQCKEDPWLGKSTCKADSGKSEKWVPHGEECAPIGAVAIRSLQQSEGKISLSSRLPQCWSMLLRQHIIDATVLLNGHARCWSMQD
ncbi:hypothetical protein M514_04816, partial [Trichuris suis]